MELQQYGPTLLVKKVATKDDLSSLVLCVPELPDVTEVVEGTVMQLTKSQRGYAATHFYKSLEGKWVDVSAAYGPDNRIAALSASYEYETVQDEGTTYYTGYLLLNWVQMSDNALAGELIYEVVVRKLDDYPIDLEDGQVLVRAPKGDTHHSYKYFDEITGNEELVDRYRYTVFHVFASGWWSRTDIPV